MSALDCSQLSQHPLLHPLTVSHDQFDERQGIRACVPVPLLGVMTVMLRGGALTLFALTVSLQSQIRITEVVVSISFLDEGVSVLSL